MANPRPTFQQRLFSDEELPLPLHDQIVRWTDLALKKQLHPILDALSVQHSVDDDGTCRGWRPGKVWDDLSEHDKPLRRAADELIKRIEPAKPFAPEIRSIAVAWEPILRDERGTIIGAVDLLASIRISTPVLHLSSERIYDRSGSFNWANDLLRDANDAVFATEEGVWRPEEETPIGGLRPALPNGTIALICSSSNAHAISRCHWTAEEKYDSDIPIYIEAKTKIRSAGELLRQINLYKSVARSGSKFLVVAPASAWEPEMKEILNEQRVATLNYMAN